MSDEQEFDDLYLLPEDEQHRDKANKNVLIWILIGLGITTLVCGGVGVLLIGRVMTNLGNMVENLGESGRSVADNPGARSTQMEETRTVLTRVLEGDRYQGVSPDEVEAANRLVEDLADAIEADSDQRFKRLVAESEFQNRVFNSSQASPTAKAYRFQYRGWMEFYCPDGTRPRLLAVSKENGGDLVIHTSMNPERYNAIISWHASYHRGRLKIVDWVEVENATPHSEQIAREFSGAIAGDLRYDNYLNLMENKIEGDGLRAQLTGLIDKAYPPQLEGEVFKLLAQHAVGNQLPDLTKRALDRIPAGYRTPDVWEVTARQHYLLGEDEEALKLLDTLERRVGPLQDPLELRAKVLRRLGRNDEAIETGLRSLRLDAAKLADYQFQSDVAEHLPPSQAESLTSAVVASNGSTAEIAAFASGLINSRRDLAEPLLAVIQRDGPTAAGLAMEAKLSEADGNLKAAIEKYSEAIKSATDKDPVSTWRYEWAVLMEETDAGDVAIRESPDPAQTFYDLAFDDGYLIVDTEVARKYATALKDAQPQDKNLALSAKYWSRAALLLADLEDSNDDSVWQAATSLRADFLELPEATPDTVPLLEELSLYLDGWVADAGVASQHVSEAYALLKESESINTSLINRCLALPQDQKTAAIASLIKACEESNPKDPWLDYGKAELLLAEGETEAARNKMLASYSKLSDVGDVWRMRQWLSKDAVTNDTWEALLKTVPLKDVFQYLVRNMRSEKKFDDLEDLFARGRKDKALSSEEWLRQRVFSLGAQKRWDELAELASREDTSRTYVNESILLDALLVTRRFDEADKYIAQMDADSQIRYRPQLITAQGGTQEELIKASRLAGTYAAFGLYSKPYLSDRLQSDDFADFRDQFPPQIDSYTLATQLLLCVDAPELTTAGIEKAISPTLKAAEVVALPQSLQVADRGVQMWRIDSDSVSFLLSFSQRQYDENLDEKKPKRDQLTTPAARKAVENHTSWLAIDIDWAKSDDVDSENLARQIAADLLDLKLECLAIGSPSSMVLLGDHDADWVRSGAFDSQEETFSIYRQFADQESWRESSIRQSRLKQKMLSARNPSAAQFAFRFTSGPVPWNPLPVDLHDWTPQYQPSFVRITAPNSPLLPRVFRGEKATVSLRLVFDTNSQTDAAKPE